MTNGRKIVLAGLLIAGTTAYMAYLGAAESWQYYLTVDECLADLEGFAGRKVRVSGRLGLQTLQRSAELPRVTFGLEGHGRLLPVVCSPPVPDNLAEGIEVVVEGRLDSKGILQADKILTRCASKYTSRQGSELKLQKTSPGNGAVR